MKQNLLIHDDCFNAFKHIPDASVALILCDLPYGCTDNKWDSALPLPELWQEYNRILKDGGAIVLTAIQPFTSVLVASNLGGYKCEWIWKKDKAVNFLNAKKHPMRKHESVLVFGKDKKGLATYNPQFTPGKPYYSKSQTNTVNFKITKNPNYENRNTGYRYPTSVVEFPMVKKTIHPTQKPVELFEYFIKTYSNEGDIVLDNCAGVATAAIAAMNTGRKFICIEKEEKYYLAGASRVDEHAVAIGYKEPIDLVFFPY